MKTALPSRYQRGTCRARRGEVVVEDRFRDDPAIGIGLPWKKLRQHASCSFQTSIVATWTSSWFIRVKKRSPALKVSKVWLSGAMSTQDRVVGRRPRRGVAVVGEVLQQDRGLVPRRPVEDLLLEGEGVLEARGRHRASGRSRTDRNVKRLASRTPRASRREGASTVPVAHPSGRFARLRAKAP